MRHGVVTGSFEDAVTIAVTTLWHGLGLTGPYVTAITAWHGECLRRGTVGHGHGTVIGAGVCHGWPR